MTDPFQTDLSRRERQIMDAIYRLGEATAADVLDGIPDPPSYSAVRALLRILVEKGHVRHRKEGPRYIYAPVVPATDARRDALDHVVQTFFDGSVTQAVSALLDGRAITEAELERLHAHIEMARKEGR